jgi:phosphatidylglycerol---prolipoprotein diacylglyceryl transferase
MLVSIDPVAGELFGIPVRWYGLLFSGGLAATWLAMRAKTSYTPTLTRDDVDRGMFWMSIGAIAGGRIGDLIFFSSAPLPVRLRLIFDLKDGGMSFHGGYVGVIVAVYLFSKVNSLGWQLADLTSCSAPIGLLLGRIGNFLNGEMYGPETDMPFSVTVNGVARHPTQLYEAIFEGAALFVFLYFVVPRFVSYRQAFLSSLFMLSYPVIRFWLDFLRTEEIVLSGLKMSQILSVVMLLAGICLLIYSLRLPKNSIVTANDKLHAPSGVGRRARTPEADR